MARRGILSAPAATAAVSPSNAGKAGQNTMDNFMVSYDEYGLLKANFFIPPAMINSGRYKLILRKMCGTRISKP